MRNMVAQQPFTHYPRCDFCSCVHRIVCVCGVWERGSAEGGFTDI